MAGSVNKVILVGNLGKDPEIRHTQDGRKIANFSVATSESWRDKNSGEKRERTEWHAVVIFGALADVVERYVAKGSKVYIEGSLQTRKWQDKQGNDRYSTEVVLQGYGNAFHILSGGKGAGNSAGGREGDNYQDDRDAAYEREAGSGAGRGLANNYTGPSEPRRGGFDKTLDDEIPFD